MLSLVASLLLAVVPLPDGTLAESCDLIELNWFYDERGKLVFQQTIFYDWSERESRYNVRAWRLVKNPAQLPQRDWGAGGYSAMWQDGEQFRHVRSQSFRETWTQYDVECESRKELPPEKRRGLREPRIKQPRRANDGASTTIPVGGEPMAEMIINGVRYKTIPGFSRYWAGEDGTVGTYRMRGNPKRDGNVFRLLKQWPARAGYVTVSVTTDEGKHTAAFVHRLVLAAFRGPCPDGMEGCHDPDPTRTNNQLSNLRWDTRKNNHADKWKHGTQQAGSQSAVAVLTEADALAIKHRLVQGHTLKTIAADYGVDWTTISRIRCGQNWAYVAPELNAQFPPSNRSRRFNVNLTQLASEHGVPRSTLFKRLKGGMSLADALNS